MSITTLLSVLSANERTRGTHLIRSPIFGGVGVDRLAEGVGMEVDERDTREEVIPVD